MMNNLKNEILSYDRFANYQIQIIDKKGNDHFAKDLVNYGKWINIWNTYPNIKVEGLDDKNYHNQIKFDKEINSNHLFVNNKGGYSFRVHKDDTNVYLYVVKGKKTVYLYDDHMQAMMENAKIVEVNEGEGIHIPIGTYHKVDSAPNTWALSIGYNDE
jgi:mannose-6-phosphate isomerase-like protein (cupin superfamily)